MTVPQIVLPHILPPRRVLDGKKVIFTAGPIDGGGDWQHRCIEMLYERAPGPLLVACPCRYKEGHPLFQYRIDGEHDGHPSQVPWERHMLTRASIDGCILFYAACEDKNNPRTNGEYASGTNREFHEWFYRTLDDPYVNIALGGDPGFPNIQDIANYFGGLLCEPKIEFLTSLEAVVDQAIEKAFGL
ncbi:hypothetical protein HY844_02380 [Candidatus Berkelbacteria bacterium]|nr:hypothetical protein [Candidatus Berkelbacteria bacterium]